jgi:ABC-type branched-subunit amino acid transport system substrate-binding protein
MQFQLRYHYHSHSKNNNAASVTASNALIELYLQVKMNGLTGPISFDEHGHRVGYKLDVMELVFNNEPRKV